MKKTKKTKIALLAALVLIFAIFAVGSGDSGNDSKGDQGKDSVSTTEDDNTSIGDYSVEITSCRLAKSYDGKDVVIVKYKYTNVADDNATAFYIAFDDTAYQNGVGLNEAYLLADDANYSSDNQTKEIKKGASLDVEVAYELNDTTSDVEVEVKELFSFSDRTITKTFSIAE